MNQLQLQLQLRLRVQLHSLLQRVQIWPQTVDVAIRRGCAWWGAAAARWSEMKIAREGWVEDGGGGTCVSARAFKTSSRCKQWIIIQIQSERGSRRARYNRARLFGWGQSASRHSHRLHEMPGLSGRGQWSAGRDGGRVPTKLEGGIGS